MNKPEHLEHPIEPIIYKDAKILILGTFPSPKSREYGFFYGHPRNRFWKVLAKVFGETQPESIEEKIQFLKNHKIALWDVLKSCTITGASDSSIKNPIPNNIAKAISNTDIEQIFTTGATATRLYDKYCYPETGIKTIRLPSTSPANCAMSFENLLEKYKILKKYVGEKDAG